MSREVDELFGTGGRGASPRTALTLALLLGGLGLAVAGVAVFSALPGGALVLAAWFVAERDLDRIESGYLAADGRQRVRIVRGIVLLGLVVVIGLSVVQGWLLAATDWYDQVLMVTIETFAPPPPDATPTPPPAPLPPPPP
jgi:hypothetical protein